MINENQSVSLEDRIGNLNVIAFERQQFLKNVARIRNSFKVELRNTK